MVDSRRTIEPRRELGSGAFSLLVFREQPEKMNEEAVILRSGVSALFHVEQELTASFQTLFQQSHRRFRQYLDHGLPPALVRKDLIESILVHASYIVNTHVLICGKWARKGNGTRRLGECANSKTPTTTAVGVYERPGYIRTIREVYPFRRSMRSRFICARRARFSAFALANRRCSDGGV